MCVSDSIEKPAESNETAAPADKPSPVETMVPEGLLKLSGSDAMGPNPWTREKPVASDFGLTDADFADGKVRLVGLKALKGGLLVGRPIRELKAHLGSSEARVAAAARTGGPRPGAGAGAKWFAF